MSPESEFHEPDDPTVKRTPTLLLLDTSPSMKRSTTDHEGNTRPKIEQLNDGLEYFKDEVEDLEHAKARVDVGVVTFGDGVSVKTDFKPIEDWTPDRHDADGSTPMGEAIERGIKLVEEQKDQYKNNAIPYRRPLIWLLTDGAPTDMSEGDDMWGHVQDLLDRGTDEKHFVFYAMGIGGEADMNTLESLVSVTETEAIKLDEGMFQEFFDFISEVSEQHSQPGEEDIEGQIPTDSN